MAEREDKILKIKFTLARHPNMAILAAKAASEGAFYLKFIEEVVGRHLGVKDALNRPAAYYVQEPDMAVVLKPDKLLAVLQLTGISRGTRSSEQIKEAYAATMQLVREFVEANVPFGVRVHMMVQFALDAAVEIQPGVYTALVDYGEEWVVGKMGQAIAA